MEFIEEISVGWNPRQATLKECINEYIIFMLRLKTFDPRLSEWYLGGNSRKEAMKNKVEFTYDFIKQSFYKNKKDDDYPEFTFTFGLWNGAKIDAESFGVNVSLGGDDPENYNNNCLFNFPYKGEIYEHYLIQENRDKLLNFIVDHWDAERVLINETWKDL